MFGTFFILKVSFIKTLFIYCSNLKRKHQDAIQEMTEQIDQLQKMKAKIDKDKQKIIAEIADARAATD